jgi:hypothetical protein
MTLHALGSFDVTGDTLARMVAKGRCTIEQLDHAPPGAPAGYQPKNLLRDWIVVNQSKWQQIQSEHAMQHEPVVEAWPSPRDFSTTDLPF